MKVKWGEKGPADAIDAAATGAITGWQVIDCDTGKDVGDDITWADDVAGTYCRAREVRLDGRLVGIVPEVCRARLRIIPPPGLTIGGVPAAEYYARRKGD